MFCGEDPTRADEVLVEVPADPDPAPLKPKRSLVVNAPRLIADLGWSKAEVAAVRESMLLFESLKMEQIQDKLEKIRDLTEVLDDLIDSRAIGIHSGMA